MPSFQPAKMSEHGTWNRAWICTDNCELGCAPVRKRAQYNEQVKRDRAREASHANKQAARLVARIMDRR